MGGVERLCIALLPVQTCNARCTGNRKHITRLMESSEKTSVSAPLPVTCSSGPTSRPPRSYPSLQSYQMLWSFCVRALKDDPKGPKLTHPCLVNSPRTQLIIDLRFCTKEISFRSLTCSSECCMKPATAECTQNTDTALFSGRRSGLSACIAIKKKVTWYSSETHSYRASW